MAACGVTTGVCWCVVGDGVGGGCLIGFELVMRWTAVWVCSDGIRGAAALFVRPACSIDRLDKGRDIPIQRTCLSIDSTRAQHTTQHTRGEEDPASRQAGAITAISTAEPQRRQQVQAHICWPKEEGSRGRGGGGWRHPGAEAGAGGGGGEGNGGEEEVVGCRERRGRSRAGLQLPGRWWSSQQEMELDHHINK
jgi:hypothetical protein